MRVSTTIGGTVQRLIRLLYPLKMRVSTTYGANEFYFTTVVIPSQNKGFYNSVNGGSAEACVVIPSQNEGFYNRTARNYA